MIKYSFGLVFLSSWNREKSRSWYIHLYFWQVTLGRKLSYCGLFIVCKYWSCACHSLLPSWVMVLKWVQGSLPRASGNAVFQLLSARLHLLKQTRWTSELIGYECASVKKCFTSTMYFMFKEASLCLNYLWCKWLGAVWSQLYQLPLVEAQIMLPRHQGTGKKSDRAIIICRNCLPVCDMSLGQLGLWDLALWWAIGK